MVCDRCKMIVRSELEQCGLHILSLGLGEAVIAEELDETKRKQLDDALQPYGFALINDKKSRLIEKIRNCIVELVYGTKDTEGINLSVYIAQQLHHDYTYLSNLFTEVEGTTVEQFYISLKVERIKELLMYDELSISEIAWQLHYSSVAHLSRQFKKVTGLTPSYFKQLKEKKRRPAHDL